MRPLVTVVVPVLSDTDAAARLLGQLPASAAIEVVVVDGDRDERLAPLVAAHPGARLCRTAPGRGRQMNRGARDARGRWILFVHADSTLPPGWLRALDELGSDVSGGWFRFALDDSAWQARVLEKLVAWRVRLCRLPYGDQGIFVRTEVFDALGGFREWPLLEDVEFVRRLVRRGRTVEVPLALRTSSRRWHQEGWLRRSVRNLMIVLLYFAGATPDRLVRWYRPAPRRSASRPRDAE